MPDQTATKALASTLDRVEALAALGQTNSQGLAAEQYADLVAAWRSIRRGLANVPQHLIPPEGATE